MEAAKSNNKNIVIGLAVVLVALVIYLVYSNQQHNELTKTHKSYLARDTSISFVIVMSKLNILVFMAQRLLIKQCYSICLCRSILLALPTL